MQFQIISDLHLHPNSNLVIPQHADNLIIAGDLIPFSHLHTIINLFSKFKQVILIPGNHDFYGSIIDKSKFTNILFTNPSHTINHTINNITILNNSDLTINNVHIIGTTLWTHISPNEYLTCRYNINDFQYIKNLTEPIFNQIHKKSMNFLKKTIKPNSIVISHHLPSTRLVNQFYKNHPLNPVFAYDSFEKIKNHPQIWVHGHSHDYVDVILDDCRFIRNPHGYYGEGVKVKWDCVVDA